MRDKLTFPRVFLLMLLLSCLGLWWLNDYYANLPERLSQHETIVLGQSRLVPGSEAALRVVVRDSSNQAPLESAAVKVSLASDGGSSVTLFEGQIDEFGTTDVVFDVPDEAEGDQRLIVETESALGRDQVERSVTFERDYRVLLTTDKPLYQPGQMIHMRALALSTFDQVPAAEQALEVVISDGKGNKVFRDTLTTSEFGVASTDFQLASEVNTGPYKITAQLGNTLSEKTVTVERYVLPKFAVDLSSQKPYYLPGERVEGTLNSAYFFGKPVAEAKVELEGFTFDVDRNVVLTIEGTTDAEGHFEFGFDLPEYLAGSDLDQGAGRFYLQAAVTDQTNHSESASLSLPVTQSSLIIEAIPEGGRFRPNVENILYVLTSYPDGTPAETTLDINFYYNEEQQTVETGPYGLAEVRFTPIDSWQELSIQARDAQGNQTQQEFFFEGEWQEKTVLLRPEQPAYQVGDTMNLTILTSQSRGMAYLDMIREGQTVSTQAIQVNNGEAQVAVDLTPDLYGTLELHAYKILSSGTIARDTRLVLVDQANELALEFTTDEEVYRPGDSAKLDIQVNGQDGTGAASAVGLAIVDESVFALAEQDPGFAKLYFMLEQELLQPKYDLHGFSIPDLLTTEPVDDVALRTAQESTAQAALAEAVPVSDRFTLRANSRDDNIEKIRLQQVNYFTTLSKGLFGLLLLLPMMVLGMMGWTQRQQAHFRRSVGLTLAFVGLLLLLFFLWPVPEWATGPFERIGFVMNALFELGEAFAVILSCIGLLSFLLLISHSLRHKEQALGWALLSLPLFVMLLLTTMFATSEANIYPDDSVMMWGLLAFLLLPLAFLFRAAAFMFTRHRGLAFAAFMVAFLIFSTPLSAFMGGIIVGTTRFGAPEMVDIMPVAVEKEVELEMLADAPMEEAAMESADFDDSSASVEQDGADRTDNNSASAGEPPRLRQYFPETMLWVPDGVTDDNGLLTLEVPAADSITTWRLSALASTQDGRLGSATGSLRVFQDFFIDLDLPLALTVGDEIAVPVGIFNYLPDAQTVRLEVEPMPWFELLDEASKEIVIEANEISVVYFRIRAQTFGKEPFKVTALGTQMSDAIQKEVRIYPDGKELRFTQSDRLTPDVPVEYVANVPAEAIPGTQGLTVKIYPGMMSQVVEGLDAMLQMPYGCFEQTSSTTYPNVLVLDYLQSTNQAAPEVQFKAEEYINLGYQRLTTFEVDSSGGFSLFGDPPPDRMLTAYGLQEFADMSRVHSVDPDLVQRAAFWLLGQQKSDGSWENDQGLVHESTWSNLENDSLPVTAYIVWSLADAGFVNEAQRGIDYVREFQGQAKDPYVVALVANALVATDLANEDEIQPSTQAVLDRLASLAERSGNSATWPSGVATFMGSEGQTGSIETSALAALAFLRSDSHPELANAALLGLIQQKDSFGTWYSTQATVLTLKSLIESVRAGSENVNATVTITLNDGQQRTVEVTPENFDVVQMVTFDDVRLGDNVVGIEVEGEGNLMYQVAGNYYLPWDVLAQYPELVEPKEPLTVDVSYDRTELSVNDSVNVTVDVTLNNNNEAGSRVEWGLIDLGIPPGFTVQSEDLAALVEEYNSVTDKEQPTIERYELTGRQILIYIGNLSAEQPISFSYRLKAKYPLVAQTPASNVYDYYNPDVAGQNKPQTLVVQE